MTMKQTAVVAGLSRPVLRSLLTSLGVSVTALRR
jgi:hypothetical protein